MTATTDRAAQTRITSPDGTQIACFTSGEGPPLVLVHGTTADHARWAPILGLLEAHATVHAIDRRGRGASSDGPVYAIEREYEDVAAVVDHVAAASGQKVDVLGHSYGGVVAYGAAHLTENVHSLLLYEGWPAADPASMSASADVHERMGQLLGASAPEAALELFMREVVGMPDAEFAIYRTLPAWPRRVAAAHTILREERSVPAFDADEAAGLALPVLLLVGSDSPPSIQNDYATVAAALPDVRVEILEGQQHIAMDLVPEEFSRRVVDFLRSGPGA
ncbi:alpha/beta fold hydrolase [Egicoccus sp. AB-alg2]|uniref:alpha/beta fold hydrolase n=1 Tax=Egicoccus sp. AB-alg2 TaxID=3242693 RepID=UPI00359E7218